MKKLILFFVLLITASLTYSQVEVSSRLQQALLTANQNDYIKVLVLLRSQVDLSSLDQQLYDQKSSLQQRAFQVITALKQNAENTQAELKSYLNTKSESAEVYTYEAFWIANMFMVEAKPIIINELMTRLDVSEMDLDALLELDRPEKVEGYVDGIESVEPGLKIINAHLLWAQGITGQGRIVMDIDTGVFPNHPALNFKWRGNHVPSNQAWFDPVGGTTVPSDCDGHGSHTMGTMVGWSPTTGDTVGVAPDAEWIAAKTICTSPHTSNSVAAFQWAINPDGDPLTISDMPDVISNSWYDPDVSNECSGIYKTTLDAVEAAGIAVVFSAGNNGPGTSTITKPKNINTNNVNVMCTAAIDGASYLGGNTNPIASFSSRGPSLCGGTGSLLIKPEVSAPGVSVRSSGSATGYTVLSGTSMASPHVAGAVALLKQFAPNLTGKQILEALYNTAVDLGAAGEDNNYGMGLIDVYAAFLSLGTADSTAPDPITDLSVVSPTSNSLNIQWTVPYDSSMNGVRGYDIRYSTSAITDSTTFYNAAILPYTAIPDTAGAIETYLVEGLAFATPYYFSIKSKDVWGNWSDLSNTATGTTLAAPQISVTPASINNILNPFEVVVDTVTISNISANPSTLDFSVALENNTFPDGIISSRIIPKYNQLADAVEVSSKDNPQIFGGVSIDGSGGPDLFGYKWRDSNEPNGPQYVWNDITSSGTLATNWIPTGTYDPKDEGYTGPFPLGFNCKFYGQEKNQIYVSSNGLILFNTINTNIFSNAQIPSAADPNEYIAPFWDDLDGVSSGTVHYKQEGSTFIIQFTGWHKYSNSGSLTFQIVIHQNGKIVIYYNNMNATLNSATVGIENAAGNDGLQVAYNANYVANNLALEFAAEPDWLSNNLNSGTLFNGNSVDVELTFRAEDYPAGNYSMDFNVASNDPVNPTVTVPVTMEISIIPVELTSFVANNDRNNVTLNWATATEVNNSGFQIERKPNGSNEWISISFVSGKGTSTERSYYSYLDKSLAVGKYSYRLKQVDLDGTFEYSPEIEVDVNAPDEFTLYQNYPNPFNPATTIEYSLPEKADVTISIYTSIGELVTTLVNGTIEAGYQKATFNAANLTSGTYIYQMKAVSSGRTFVDTKKMLLIK
ncbi:MAG TPA: S8 family serine peptidase [Ignavibacteriaceae bacterium]